VGRAIDDLIRVVPSLQALDPVTTELVRLLGARRHRCRICQSLRSRSALVAGADDALFAAVDQYATSDLEPAQRAALAFAEAMLGVPGRVDLDRARALLEHFPPAACVELVLDVTRNAANKVAVALAADAPRVETGYEIYDVTPEGELLYGLDAP
jgi:alkylhydroperoxidase family enzyme